MTRVIVVGGGNAALCAAISAREQGAEVLVLERAPFELRGGNSRFTAGGMRIAYDGNEDIRALIPELTAEELARTDFGSYPRDRFYDDMGRGGEPRQLVRLPRGRLGQARARLRRTRYRRQLPVLDPFMGSGSTLVAAANCGRNGLGVEVDPVYMRMALARLHNETDDLLKHARVSVAEIQGSEHPVYANAAD